MPKVSNEKFYEKVKAFLENAGHDTSDLEMPLLTEEEKVLEADAVYLFWERKGQGFTIKPCKECGLDFAYAYTYDSVAFCSIECRRDALAKIGIKWHPGKPLKDRWGHIGKKRATGEIDSKTKKPILKSFAAYPAVVPPVPLNIIQTSLSSSTEQDAV